MSNTPQTPEKQADHSIDTATGQEAPAEISSARVKKIFTDIAWKYERFNKLSSFGQYRSWLRTLIDKSPITSETLMLDIAGGTGDVTFTACERKQPKHRADSMQARQTAFPLSLPWLTGKTFPTKTGLST